MVSIKSKVVDHVAVRLLPDFDAFLASHPWVGPKGWSATEIVEQEYAQQFQNVTAYGRDGGEVHEVYGANRGRYSRLGSRMLTSYHGFGAKPTITLLHFSSVPATASFIVC